MNRSSMDFCYMHVYNNKLILANDVPHQGRIQDFWKGGGANLRQQSLGMRSIVELRGSGGIPPGKF